MVVIKGLAITAGSKPTFSATRGSTQPINFANITTTIRVAHITNAPGRAYL